ncbi:hypothetical protein IEQ34_007701 [Dendrobium chrysotoxum]|uniref:Protein SDA1 n=1 Tax=Dendrobium chrysotoxum TaxID=161865 RepID=A0AAV7H4W7_DENCH|nr:hypothetical protein IEQ34_007701 [Dendrobium chrysotoxum]
MMAVAVRMAIAAVVAVAEEEVKGVGFRRRLVRRIYWKLRAEIRRRSEKRQRFSSRYDPFSYALNFDDVVLDMGRNLSPLVQEELQKLEKDPESSRLAMKILKSYATNIGSKAIPQFLAQVSENNNQGSLSGECTISLFEVLARVHGRNIVSQIGCIMTTIIRTLSTSAGSFPLHQACSRVILAIARYGIDPSTPNDEKKIISSLLRH